jgi:hypothetical protein
MSHTADGVNSRDVQKFKQPSAIWPETYGWPRYILYHLTPGNLRKVKTSYHIRKLTDLLLMN